MIRLAILISGSGTTAEAIVQAGIEPVVVIASRPDAPGIAKMQKLGFSVEVLDRPDRLLALLESAGAEVVSQNGWLPLTPANVITRFHGRIINQHPGPLDPGRIDFGGKGMYGKRVTCARIAYARVTGKDYWTESSVHHVTERFDEGPVIRIERLVFDETSTTEQVARTLLPLEHKNVVAVLRQFVSSGSFPEFKRQKPLITPGNESLVSEVKKRAMQLFPNG